MSNKIFHVSLLTTINIEDDTKWHIIIITHGLELINCETLDLSFRIQTEKSLQHKYTITTTTQRDV